MANRRNLDSAHQEKNDEFFTQYEDVEREMNSYLDYDKDTFKDKTVFCPCDDSDISNFTRYFAQNFQKLGLKKLICTSYAHRSKYGEKEVEYEPTPLETQSSLFDYEKSISHGKVFILEDNGEENINLSNVSWKYLEGDGDFRSDECIALRNESDIIITNPPFSLFREFILWIFDGNKKFIILGNQNAITYKEVYPLIKGNKMWLGCRFNERVNGKNLTYRVPKHYEMNASELFIDEDTGDKYITVPGTGWFTNVDHGKRHQPLSLMTMANNLKFSKHPVLKETGYLKYDNYDAIDIPFVDSIPSDYDGCMGVPITFLGKYCPEQFEIITFRKGNDGKDLSVNGNSKYFRIIIRRK